MSWDLISHLWAEKMLQQHIVSGQVKHAYLFTGPVGVGRRSLALHFAMAINCLQPNTPGTPCGTCRNCVQIQLMQHPDLSIVQAELNGGVIKVEQIRELQHQLSLTPYEAKSRIALLLRLEEANENAQNALLKTLEEPNEKVILLITADMAENLLPTISSRCEVIRLRPAPVNELASALIEREKIDPDKAQLVAHIAGGRPGFAYHLLHESEILEKRQSWLEDLLILLNANRRQRLAYCENKFYSRSEDRNEIKDKLHEAFSHWLSFWRDVLLTVSHSEVPLINLDFTAQVGQIAGQIDLKQASFLTRRIENSLPRLNNANLRLLAESLILEWPQIS
jgi:DNA polymerase III subunit delta'